MDKNFIKCTNPNNLINQISVIVGGNIFRKDFELKLIFNSQKGKGVIKIFKINNALINIQIEATFHYDLTIDFEFGDFIAFVYCLEGCFENRIGKSHKNRIIKQFQTAIFKTSMERNYFIFRNNIPCNLNFILTCSSTANADTELQNSLINSSFSKLGNNEVIDFVGSSNLQIREQIKQIDLIKDEGLVKAFTVKGILYLTLALQIKQYLLGDSSEDSIITSLNRKDITKVKKISELIINHPSNPFTISELSEIHNISPAKLQEGFKLLHNTTVSDFITQMRLELAEELVRTSDLNISEIVYKIGFSSRSYFSKIFKEKYNSSPKDYRKNHRPL